MTSGAVQTCPASARVLTVPARSPATWPTTRRETGGSTN